MIVIEKNIPLPPPGRKPMAFPLRDMAPGDSFRVDASAAKAARAAAFNLARATDMAFATRRDGDGIRIWRTA